MKLNSAAGIIIAAFVISLSGFILSAAIPQSTISDTLMTVALFGAAASGLLAAVFTEKLVKSVYWKYFIAGVFVFLAGFLLRFPGYRVAGEAGRVCGGITAITALTLYIYRHSSDFKNSTWILFIPFILLGCLFKHLYWPGGNLIIFVSLLVIVILSVLQLAKPKQNSIIQSFFLSWQISMCVCITVFYFGEVDADPFFIGYIFILLALVDIFLHQEKE